MGKFKDLTGLKFGRLTVIERAESKLIGNQKRTYWRCKCDCGSEVVITGGHLVSGHTQSCGCLQKERVSESSTTHGLSHTKIDRIYDSMMSRCYNSKCKEYWHYGNRGITVCDEWRGNRAVFFEYIATLPHFGEKGYELDRIDNNGNYEPSNVRWADRKTQVRNRRNTFMIEYNGVKMPLAESAELSGIPYKILHQRYQRGDRGERLFRPVRK